MTLKVVHPRRLDRCGAVEHWVYADDDEDEYRAVARHPAFNGKSAVSPQEFARSAAAARAEYVSWIDASLQDARPELWLTTPLYRNPHDNPLFLHYCWLREIDSLLSAGRHDLTVVTASSGLARALQQICGTHGVPCARVGIGVMWLARVRRLAEGALFFAGNACSLAWRMLMAKLILGEAHRTRTGGVDVLIDTYLADNDLANDGSHIDRYTPGLIDFYSGNRLKTAVYPVLFRIAALRIPSLFWRMRRSKTLIVPFELYLTLTDFFAVLFESLRQSVARVDLRDGDADEKALRPLVEWLQPVTALRAFAALAMLRAPRRLAAAGVAPSLLVEWYENQPIDKANHIGFSHAGVRVVAMRQYPPAANYLSLYSTTTEVEAGAAPRENWVCGKAQAQQMALYDRAGVYEVVPALRYAHLHAPPALREGSRLLVLLPYSQADSAKILHCVWRVFGDSSGRFDAIVVKPHHTQEARAHTREHPFPARAHIAWTTDPLPELLRDAKVVVTAHSSAAVEAVCYGRPVVVIARKAGVPINPLESIDERLWQTAYDAGGLSATLDAWNPDHPLPLQARIALGHRVRDALFEPANASSMRAFLAGLGDSR